MAMLIGITNENEFYSQHFIDEQLSSTVENKIKDGLEKEKKEKIEADESISKGIRKDPWKAPWTRLNIIARETLKNIRSADLKKGESRIKVEEEILSSILNALDLPFDPKSLHLEKGLVLPLVGEIKTVTGEPYLWIFQATSVGGVEDIDRESEIDSDTDPLELRLCKLQLNTQSELSREAKEAIKKNWLSLLGSTILTQNNAPRWVLLCGLHQWVLVDRSKFSQRRILRFDWMEIFSRRETKVLQIVSLLLGRDTFSQVEGQCYLDVLDENSHKHAHGVSSDLKYALRESIELLGNEAARQLREKAALDKKGFFSGENRLKAEELSDECLRYMYRLLFLFFVESRPELKYAPVGDEAYLEGYSLEGLRDLELIPLNSETERKGLYLHKSINRLFKFFEEGTPEISTLGIAQATKNAFTIQKLPSTLFDHSKMPLLEKVAFPNYILQRVIELMSLSRPAKGNKKTRRGRISYAHLGLNQLGAVYEALLSYRGFFADETLYEVKKKDEGNPDPLAPAFFVTEEDLKDYADEEKVFDKDPITGVKTLRKYPKGTFIYRMSGSARENSASYYTPEVLTKCLVEESLDVLVKQQLDDLPDDKAKAEKILSWRICEPAMGSAAFLNEAVNQVATLYMSYAMRVPGAKPLTQDAYQKELQKVKMFLADRNIYGVDLNPVAVELGEVSLWLNALSDDKYVPWFGLQLQAGNSLLGCRRQAFYRNDLNKKECPPPHDIGPEGIQEGEIWHFLIPDSQMSNYKDPDVVKLEKEGINKIRKWNKAFNSKFSEEDLDFLGVISIGIDNLWQKWARKLQEIDDKTTDPYSIYGHEESDRKRSNYFEKKKQLEIARFGDGSFDSGEFARLKLIMDYWCALWFWPIQKADLLPSREEYFQQIRFILSGEEGAQCTVYTGDLFYEKENSELKEQENKLGYKRRWEKRVKILEQRFPQLSVVRQVAQRELFMHWPLRFATIFLPQNGESAGFDLTLGNPPWKIASWNSGAVLGDVNPKYVIHGKEYSAKKIQEVVTGKIDLDNQGRGIFERSPQIYKKWLETFESISGGKDFFNSTMNYPELIGCRTDLFKVFLPIAWRHSSKNGVQGLVHPDTVYTETNGTKLRKIAFSRLRKHYQFSNELKLFADVDHHTEFSLNVYGSIEKNINFQNINNLFIPKTIKSCFSKNNSIVEGRKNLEGSWNTKGHPHRVIEIDKNVLRKIAKIFGGDIEVPLLPSIHTIEILSILEKFINCAKRLKDFGQELNISSIWNETTTQQNDTIKEFTKNETRFPSKIDDSILNGPHISVGSALFKCPENPCTNNTTWLTLDLTNIPDDYLPRVKYHPNVERSEYLRRMPKVSWDPDKFDKLGRLVQTGTPFDQYYRLSIREFIGADAERSLTSGILPPGVCHINVLQSLAFKNSSKLLTVAGYFCSLPLDFFIRQQNKKHLHNALLERIPLPDFGIWEALIRTRTLCLNSLTKYYSDFWKENFNDEMRNDCWTIQHEALDDNFFRNLTDEWKRTNALRTDLERRQALLEIDVLVSLALGFTLEELQTCYRIGFRVMRSYDQETYYDQTGRIIFTPNGNGLKGVGLSRKAKANDGESYAVNGVVKPKGLGFEDVKNLKGGVVSRTFTEDTLPGGPIKRTIHYKAPFFKMNREEDYARAWKFFSALKNKNNKEK